MIKLNKILLISLFSLLTAVFALTAQANYPTCARQFSTPNAVFGTLENGPVTVVIDADEVPPQMGAAMLNHLFGSPVIAVDHHEPSKPKLIKGTVVHLGDAGYLKRRIVGQVNLTKGFRNYYEKFDNKIQEYLWATKIDPDIMPLSTVFSDYAKEIKSDSRGREILRDIKNFKEQLVDNPDFKIGNSERILLVNFVERFLDLIHRDFPSGAIIKLAGEFQSADASGILKSRQIDIHDVISSFVKSYENLKKSTLSKNHRRRLSEKDFKTDGSAVTFDKNWSFIKSLVFGEFQTIMAQKKEVIVREGRLSMANGKIYNAVDRFYDRWAPEELFVRGKSVLDEFIKKAIKSGFPMDKMSGGVDFALLADGRIVILDFNFGAMDGFLDGIKSPITTNMFISNVIGQPTPLLLELSRARELEFDEKLNFIFSLGEKYLGHLNLEDKTSVTGDMVRWLGQQSYLSEKEETLLFRKTQERFQK